MQGFIKHKANWAQAAQCGLLIFSPESQQYEVSGVPFLVTRPRLQVQGNKWPSHHFKFPMTGMTATWCASVLHQGTKLQE